MISAMNFVQIVGPHEQFEEAVDVVHTAGVLQIEEVPLVGENKDKLLHRFQLSSTQIRQKELYHELLRILDEEALGYLPRSVVQGVKGAASFEEQYGHWGQQDDNAIAATVRALHAEVRSFKRRSRNIDNDLRVLTAYEEVVAALTPLIQHSDLPQDHMLIGILLERKSQRAQALLQKHVDKLTAGEYVIMQAPLAKGRKAALLAFHPKFLTPVREFIGETGISEVRGPRYLRDKPFDQILLTLEQDLTRLRQKRAELTVRKDRFFEEKAPQLLALRGICFDTFGRLDALSKFAQTRYTFIMEGWMPSKDVESLQAQLDAECDGAAFVRCVRAHGAASSPPVRLSNPGPVKSFETLLALLPLPKYGSIDPTWFMATFFPPIFGLMLGDIGYGLLLVLGTVWLWRLGRRVKVAQALAVILGSCAFFTILFGVVFGEFFGTAGHHLGLRPLWRERLEIGSSQIGETLLMYLGMAVAVGVVHVICGLVLGIINARKSNHAAEGLAYTARIFGLFGLFFVIGRLVQALPPVFTSLSVVAWILFLVFMLWTYMRHPLHGLMLPLELIGTVGNILSYARIMAVGMASAVLALLANQFGSMIDNVVLAVIVVVLVHALNLVLGVVDPTIQGLRLHYVEFFSKFYLSGGRLYSPFKKMGDQVL